MAFNVVCSLLVVMAGGAVEIYSFSNVGYTVSFIPVLIGYFLLRQDKPHLRRPFKLPEFMKYVALASGGGVFRVLAVWRPLVLEDRQCGDLLLARLGRAARHTPANTSYLGPACAWPGAVSEFTWPMALLGVSTAGTAAKSKNSSVLFNLKISSIGTA